MRRGTLQILALLAVVIIFPYGCATPGPNAWGADVSFVPTGQRLRDAASDAVKNPHVWIPLAGAAVFQIDGWDRKVSNWARENTPVFGSQHNASDWSDRLVVVSSVSYLTTVIVTRGPENSDEWLRAKARGLAVGLGAIASTEIITIALKAATSRTRPNEESTESFPSGHASGSAALAGLTSDNLRYTDLTTGTQRGLSLGLDAVTIGTAWARVEAGAHFPSDTLVGMALGYFISAFFDDAFLHGASNKDKRVALTLAPLRGGFALQWQQTF